MKTINKILGLLLIFTAVATSCTRDYDAPPLVKPEYVGPEENIDIKGLKEVYKDVTEATPQLVEHDYIVRGRVISSDASGNIFKQIYIEDNDGGINLGVEESNTSTMYALGQEVYINLRGLAIVNYGGELQIGFQGTNANRIPWNIFTKHVQKNDWPKVDRIKITEFTDFAKFADKNVNTLVRLDGVHFTEGGKAPYAEEQKTVNRDLLDAQGNKLILRTSGYSNFYSQILPVGTGSVIGILSRHRGEWQLMLRSIEDVLTFDGIAPGDEGPVDPQDPDAKPNTTMREFATKYAAATAEAPMSITDDILLGGVIVSDDTDGNVFKKVFIEDETGGITVGVNDSFISKTYAAGTKIVFNAKGLDAIVYEGLLQIGKASAQASRIELSDFTSRVTVISKDNPITPKVKTIPALTNADLNTLIQFDGVTIVEAGQVYAPDKQNANRIIKDANGNTITLRNSGYSKFASQVMPSGNLSITALLETHKGEWQLTIRSTNDVKSFNGEVPTDPTDPVGGVLLKEAFGPKFAKPASGFWPKIAVYTGYEDKNVTYSDPTNNADIRNTATTENHVWFKANADGEFVVTGLANSEGKKLTLSYSVASGVYQETEIANLNSVEVWYNDQQLATESKEVKGKADANKFYDLSIQGISGANGAVLKFVVKGANNKYGFRLTNLELSSK